MEFKTPKDFENYFRRVMQKVLDGIAEEVLVAIRQSINYNTYIASGLPNASYLNDSGLPSFEFRDKAWQITKAKQIASEVVSSVNYMPQKMSPPSSGFPFRHGNYYQQKDRREQLAELLNVYGSADNADFRTDGSNSDGSIYCVSKTEKKRRPFFDLAITWIVENWDNLVVKHFRRQGIDLNIRGLTGVVPSFSSSMAKNASSLGLFDFNVNDIDIFDDDFE